MEFPWINLQWIYRKILKSSFVHWTEFTLQTFPPSMVHRHVWFQWLAKDDGFGCHLCGMWDGLHPVSNTLFPAPGWLQLAKVLTNKAAIKSFSGMSIVTFFFKRLQLAWKQFFEPQNVRICWVLPRSTTFLLCDVQEKFRGVIDQMSGPRTGGLCRGVFIPSLFFVRI